MNNFFFLALLLVLAGTAAFFGLNWYEHNRGDIGESSLDFGTYPYRCENGLEFTMSPRSGLTSILIEPGGNAGAFQMHLLSRVGSGTGARFEADGVVFHAHGETVELSAPDFTTTCIPVPNPGEAPFNFGD